MNLGELVTAVERRTGVRYDRDALIEVVNEGLQAVSKVQDWGWLEETWALASTGAASYTPPDGWAKIRSVKVGEQLWPMLPITQIEQSPYDDGWTVDGDVLVISPAPVAGVPISVRYYATEPALTADADTPLLPAEWHPALVHYATAVILERGGDKEGLGRADRSMARYETVVKQMKGQANRAKGPHRVRVRPGSML